MFDITDAEISPDKIIDPDFAILEQYQKFSSELLRISLIGVTAIGYVVSRMTFPRKASEETVFQLINRLPTTRVLLVASLACLVLSVAAALTHRYFSTDSMAYHLSGLRLLKRNEAVKAQLQFDGRDARFKWSACAIAASAGILTIGAVLLVVAIFLVLLQASQP